MKKYIRNCHGILLGRPANYYQPSAVVVDALDKELLYLSGRPPQTERTENTKSKRKHDLVDRIFQSLLDVTYFLEFIEDHHELHDLYEDDLKDLFGVSIDDSSPLPFHKNNRGGLFSRFLISSIFGNWAYSDGVENYSVNDFRLLLIDNMIDIAIEAIRFRLGKSREAALFSSNAQNTTLWSDIIAGKYKPKKERVTHRRIGYSISLPSHDRLEYEAESRKPKLSNS
jgi:hypothetical protein